MMLGLTAARCARAWQVTQRYLRNISEYPFILGNLPPATRRQTLKPLKGRAHVNLIPLNPTRGFGGRPTGVAAAKAFVKTLDKYGLPGTVRVRRGIDIDAGCGQLAEEASKLKAEAKLMDKLMKGKERASGKKAPSVL